MNALQYNFVETLDPAAVAFFVDFDDTLIESQPDPVTFVLPPALRTLAARLVALEHFKFVIVTGRSIAQVDAFFAPFRFPVIGCHGAEIRMTGAEPTQPLSLPFPDQLRNDISALAGKHGWLVENKEFGMAVHCLAPGQDVMEAAQMIEQLLGNTWPDWRLYPTGRCVDIRSRKMSKGAAIQLFQQRPLYAGRQAVYIGDDALSDASLAFLKESGGRLLNVEKPGVASDGQGFPGPRDVRVFLEHAASAR